MITINKEQIAGALNVASTMIKTKTIVPLTSYINLTCKDGKLRIRSTDLENQYESHIAISDNDVEFEFSVPSLEFNGVVLKLTKDEFELSHHIRDNNSSYVLIKAGRGKYEIETSQDPFPFKDMSEEDGIEIDFEALSTAFKRASTCPDPKEMRPTFNGCSVMGDANGIRIEGSRPSMLTRQYIQCNGMIEDCLIPLRFASILASLSMKGLCKLYRDDNRLGVTVLGTKITTQLLNNKPADQEKIFAQTPTSSITLNRIEALNAVKRVGNFSHGDASRIILDIKGEVVTLVGDQRERGNHAEEEITITNDKVDEMRVGVNAIQVDNILSNIESEYVQVFMNVHSAPLFFTPLGHESETQKWINGTINIANEG